MWINICLVLTILECSWASSEYFFVSPEGADSNDGRSPTTPVKTLHQAIHLAKKIPDSGAMVYVELMAGYYDLNTTLYVDRDRVTIRPYKDEEVHVTGGKRVPCSLFKRVTDPNILSRFSIKAQEHVRVAHLPDVGITDYGTMSSYGFGKIRIAPLEVFYNGKPLLLAQWPNEGFINIVEVPDGINGSRFQYNSTVFTEPLRWHNEPEIWTYGYWIWSWADESVKVKSFDAYNGTVTLTNPPQHGLTTGHWNDPDAGYTRQGGYFRFINILSALDQPGEFYMDRQNGNLYVWFPSTEGDGKDSDIIYVSLINRCIWMRKRQYITITGFTLEACRGYGIQGSNVNNVKVSKMEIRNTGSVAVNLREDSRYCSVTQSLIHDTDGGVYMQGGNRSTIEGSGNTVVNNEIYLFSRVAATSSWGIQAIGVGHLIRYNTLYSGQYGAVWYYGNNNVMEHNLLHHVCQNASDCGAFHTGRDWTTRGNIIRYNIVHHTLRLVPGSDVRGVMLDDQSSSTTITNNVFYNNHVHANIGGGRYNVIKNNVMYNATAYSIQVDNRGTKHKNDDILISRLYAMPYHSPQWISQYPELVYLNLKNASLPEGNQIVKNLVYNTDGREFVHKFNQHFAKPNFFNISETEISTGRDDFYDVDAGDFRLKGHAAEWAKKVNFGFVASPNDVGPRVPVGPTFIHRDNVVKVDLSEHSTASWNSIPSSETPVASYLPDGSRENDFFDVSNEGCWLSVSGCTDHPEVVGTYRDSYGESHKHAAKNETMCFQRAVEQWRHCGAYKNEQVAAIYGPTGATRLAGDGCFLASYGCPKHEMKTKERVISRGKIYRDIYAETGQYTAHDEEACLRRALRQWLWCGASRSHPVTSIYRPTGSIRTAGAGCWIHVQHCPNIPGTNSMFFDAWGARTYHTDSSENACLNQAEYYWNLCGSDGRYPVTSYFRPTTASKTFVQRFDEENPNRLFPVHKMGYLFSSFASSITNFFSSTRQIVADMFQL